MEMRGHVRAPTKLVPQVASKNHPVGSDGVKDFAYVAAGGKSKASTFPFCVAYNDFAERHGMSAGLESEGTHLIQTPQPSCKHSSCQEDARSCISLDLLHPLTSAHHTLWVSIKKMISCPRNFSPGLAPTLYRQGIC